MKEYTVEGFEHDIAEAQKDVDRFTAYKKLAGNREFKRLILDGYLRDEALRLVQASNQSNLTDAGRAAVIRDIQAISSFQEFLGSIGAKAMAAEKTIREAEAEIEAIRAEED